ncbi:Protein lysine methyltransferase [Mycena indigotica]|uniref:Protein lysine methyltransferase n=1 Tax=Mycena indigotica TaxID=2126181 RepID=A0A8H6W6W5_9AGAR|nr:Protein lysine methyltransferase [Mycena indigotica]KAF7303843.1 Protein lysine methyltransferase [Mycena indigotica]
MSQFFVLAPTSYGGRGVFASQSIPKDTLVHTCPAPYASVIYREFRKEVCAQCFDYSFDARRNAWNIRLDGFYFCSDGCLDDWKRENPRELIADVVSAIDRLTKSMVKGKSKSNLSDFATPSPGPEALDTIWGKAEQYPIRGHPVVFLDELELEHARFVLSGLIRRHADESSNSWSDMLELQDNELHYIRQRPGALSSQIRVYIFIRLVVREIPVLSQYVETSDSVRAILSRDPGNVFGIYETNQTGDSEMFGWCMYVSASFFNHDCNPNIRKRRSGRAMCFYTTRDVSPAEELCTNYISLEDSVTERRQQLSSNWYFDCGCQRCKDELSETG